MSSPKFVWIIRYWCNVDSFWEHVREHKEYDIAYAKPELALEEMERIFLKEKTEWEDMCKGTGVKPETREFSFEKPSPEQLKNRSFFKFLTMTTSDEVPYELRQTWYVERLKIVDLV